MILLFLGAPGSGKGTQSERFSKKFKIAKFATGDILREEIRKESKLGSEAKTYVEQGILIPDKLISNIVQNEIEEADYERGFILDGFPRNFPQAKFLDEFLKQKNLNIDRVIYLKIDKSLLIERLSGRYVNPRTGREYHIKYSPPKIAGICDDDGMELIRRVDDQPEKLSTRWEVYQKETLPLINYYNEIKKLVEIEAGEDIETVTNNILKILQSI